jgi:peptide/nickel transport system permease protein
MRADPAPATAGLPVWRAAWLRRGGWVSLSSVILGVLVLLAIGAPLFAPDNPVRADDAHQLLAPSARHLFGTDANGMDIFSRVLWGARTDLAISLLGVGAGAVAGTLTGAFAGYLGRLVDEAVSRVSDMLQAIPIFLFALMVVAALGNSRLVLVGIVAVTAFPVFFKLTRSVAAPLRGLDFIAAARCAGLGPGAIVIRHVLPNSLEPVLSQLSVQCAYAIQVIAGLSFLGLGVPVPQPEWGAMIQEGAARILYGQWWVAFFPGLAVFLAVIAFEGVGRRLEERYQR